METFVAEIDEKDLNPPAVLFNTVESIAGALILDSSSLSLENMGSCLQEIWEVLSGTQLLFLLFYVFFIFHISFFILLKFLLLYNFSSYFTSYAFMFGRNSKLC